MGLFVKKIKRRKDEGNFLSRYVKSFFHAVSGVVYSILHEHNMIIILLAMVVVVLGGIYFKISNYEWLFCIGMMGAVSASEMLNTAIEATVDLITVSTHPLAKIAKDTAASSTLLLSITAFAGAVIIFLPKIMEVL